MPYLDRFFPGKKDRTSKNLASTSNLRFRVRRIEAPGREKLK
jgi:hypothetical protein